MLNLVEMSGFHCKGNLCLYLKMRHNCEKDITICVDYPLLDSVHLIASLT